MDERGNPTQIFFLEYSQNELANIHLEFFTLITFITFIIVLVSCSCCNKTPYTGEVYVLTILEADSPRSSCWQGWFPWRPLSLVCKWWSLPCVLTCSSLCVCLCPNILFLKGHLSCWLKTHLDDHILMCSPLSRPCLQTQSHSEVLGSGRNL